MRMRKNNIVCMLSAFIMAGSMVGCGKFLDTCYNINQTEDIIAQNAGSIWSFANAFYSPIGHGLQSIDYNLFATVSDECQQAATSSNALYFNRGIINESVNPLFSSYENYYEGIRAANFFLEFVKDGKGEELLALNRDIVMDEYGYNMEVQSLNYYIAEAHIAKAYYYSELIKMYGGVPIVESPKVGEDALVPRSSYEDCVEYIVKEIDEWKNYLAMDWSEFAEREGRFTYGVALAIKARTLLYAASPLHNPENDLDKWDRAVRACGDLINLGKYSLSPKYDMFSGSDPLTSPESIYVVRTYQSNDPEKANYPISTPGGRSGACPTQNLVDAYEYIDTPDAKNPYLNKDPRFAASIVYNGAKWNGRVISQGPSEADDMSKPNTTPTGYYLRKFLTDELNLEQGQAAQHNWIAFRYAEVLLNYAEAVNEVYGPDEVPVAMPLSARAALQMVRDRASTSLPPVTASTVESFRNAVKHERQVELAFEDHRYWDLLRWKDAETVLNNPVKGVEIAKVSGVYQYSVVDVAGRKFSEANYYLPFLRSEIQNSAGTLQQNPGY